MGLLIGMICHVFPGTKPSEYMKIPPSPRAMGMDGKIAIQVLKALNPAPEKKDEGIDMAKRRVSMARSKINKRDPYTKQAIERRGLKI